MRTFEPLMTPAAVFTDPPMAAVPAPGRIIAVPFMAVPPTDTAPVPRAGGSVRPTDGVPGVPRFWLVAATVPSVDADAVPCAPAGVLVPCGATLCAAAAALVACGAPLCTAAGDAASRCDITRCSIWAPTALRVGSPCPPPGSFCWGLGASW
jgi:hypothetical protein